MLVQEYLATCRRSRNSCLHDVAAANSCWRCNAMQRTNSSCHPIRLLHSFIQAIGRYSPGSSATYTSGSSSSLLCRFPSVQPTFRYRPSGLDWHLSHIMARPAEDKEMSVRPCIVRCEHEFMLPRSLRTILRTCHTAAVVPQYSSCCCTRTFWYRTSHRCV